MSAIGQLLTSSAIGQPISGRLANAVTTAMGAIMVFFDPTRISAILAGIFIYRFIICLYAPAAPANARWSTMHRPDKLPSKPHIHSLCANSLAQLLP